MGSGKHEKRSKTQLRNPKKLGPNRGKTKTKSKKKIEPNKNELNNKETIPIPTVSQQLNFFLDHYQSANAIRLSSLELDSFKDTCILELPQGLAQNVDNLSEHMKAAFESSWKEVLCGKQHLEGKIHPGNPAVLIISSSALRSLELLRGLRPLTRECPAAKLFSKHMKVEEQVVQLKKRVNIASGTPSRIKKLMDMESLGQSRLTVIMLDMHTDVKGYSLFTLPQIREELWDLYKSYFHERVVSGDLRICLYGPMPISSEKKRKKTMQQED